MGRRIGLKERVKELERRLIWAALRKGGGIQALAARDLGVSERVLRYKMRKYGLRVETKLLHRDIIVDPHSLSNKTKG